MLRRLVRWWLEPIIRFASRGSYTNFWAVRYGPYICLAYEDPFGICHECGDLTPEQIRDYARRLIEMANTAEREVAHG